MQMGLEINRMLAHKLSNYIERLHHERYTPSRHDAKHSEIWPWSVKSYCRLHTFHADSS